MLSKLARLLLVPFALIVVGLSRLGLPIRFGQIWATRLGHMAGNIECYLCERAAGLSRGWDMWSYYGEPFNKQLERMQRRVMWIDRTPFTRVCALVNELFPGAERHRIEPVQVDRDIYNLFEKYPPQLRFTGEEELRGLQGLLKLGIPLDAKWVYLIVRDDAKHPHLPYHSYRNARIEDHEPAALALAERGYYVVRMGKDVLKPMSVKHPRIIDFAMMKPHDDFMAVYLGARCAFCLTTGTGPDAIPVIFRRPMCYVNYVPIEYLQTYHRNSLVIWKHHYKGDKRMTLAEIYESKAGQFMQAEQFLEAGITLVDNTPEEITAVALEMDERLNRQYTYWGGDPESQEAFWSKFPRGDSEFNNRPLHGEIRMRIGREFLRGYFPDAPSTPCARCGEYGHLASTYHGACDVCGSKDHSTKRHIA